MRFTVRALVAGILMVCCRGVVAAETGSSWWPFGRHADATVAQPHSVGQASLPSATTALPEATTPPAGAGPVAHEVQLPATPATPSDANSDSHWMVNTPKKKISWPKLHMPEMPKSLSSKSAAAEKPEASKNKWAEKTPTPPKTSPMESVKSAWHKTVAAVTPAPSAKQTTKPAPPPQVASRATSPPFWKKMFGAKEPEMQQPQTVPQWMAQKRLDP